MWISCGHHDPVVSVSCPFSATAGILTGFVLPRRGATTKREQKYSILCGLQRTFFVAIYPHSLSIAFSTKVIFLLTLVVDDVFPAMLTWLCKLVLLGAVLASFVVLAWGNPQQSAAIDAAFPRSTKLHHFLAVTADIAHIGIVQLELDAVVTARSGAFLFKLPFAAHFAVCRDV